jgi:hypothetical protein
MRNIFYAGILMLGFVVAGFADIAETVNLNFVTNFGPGPEESISFNGTVWFTNDFTGADTVNGVLSVTGIPPNYTSYTPEPIDYVGIPGPSSASLYGPYGSAALIPGFSYRPGAFNDDYIVDLSWENFGNGNLVVENDPARYFLVTGLQNPDGSFAFPVTFTGGTITPIAGSPLPEPGYFIVVPLCLCGALCVRRASRRKMANETLRG